MKTSIIGLTTALCALTMGCGSSAKQEEKITKGKAASAVSEDIRKNPAAAAAALSEEELVKKRDESKSCKSKYPILLLHGIALRDNTLGVKYFGRIPDYLKERCDVIVFEGGQDAFSISSVNATQILTKILEITDDMGYEKVNIIAHSKGGIDVRFMFWQTGDYLMNGRTLKDRVASFTTLSTPHRGSGLADYLLPKFGPKTQSVIGWFLDVFGLVVGDSDESDSKAALNMLSSETLNKWNEKFGDLETGIPGIYTQSWASTISGSIADKILQTTSSMMKEIGLTYNDGAVQESSARYGHYRGLIGKNLEGGISHFAIVDRAKLVKEGDTPGWDSREFYYNIVRELSGLGL